MDISRSEDRHMDVNQMEPGEAVATILSHHDLYCHFESFDQS